MTEQLVTNKGQCVACIGCIEESNCKAECGAIDDCLEKLAAYETAEEEGRLVVLPCKPGITLYILRKKYTKCSKHNEEFDESSCCGCEDECDSRLFYYIVPCPDVTAEQILEFERLRALNKKVFFSKEEAEKALKEMKKNE